MNGKSATEYNNFAFISYSHKDMAVAKWLQRWLESFKLPTEIHNDIEAGNRYLRPIFRDQSDLNTGVLGEELRKHLEESKYLILICSKDSAQSTWVSDEAKAFVGMGRLEQIIPVIISDGDTPEKQLFPKYLRDYFAQHPEKELLGINIGEVGKEKSLIRIVSRMLDVSFDSLWKRHQRRKHIRIISFTAVSVLVASLIYLFAVPVDITVRVDTEKTSLPTGEAVILKVNGGEYTAPIDNPQFEVIHLAGYNRFKKIDIRVSSKYFNNLDTVIPAGLGTHHEIALTLTRDDTFSIFAGEVFDPDLQPIEGVVVTVAGYVGVTNDKGEFSIKLPSAEQRPEQVIRLGKAGYQSVWREDEIPSENLRFIMHKEN